MSDRAPIVYDKYGEPMRVRVVGAKCEGDVSGEGHIGYTLHNPEDHISVWFEEVN